MEEIDYDTLYDPQLVSQVLHYTVNGWPKYATGVPENLRPCHAVRGDMSVADGKLTYRYRLGIRSAPRPDTLQQDQGLTKCRQRANNTSLVARN